MNHKYLSLILAAASACTITKEDDNDDNENMVVTQEDGSVDGSTSRDGSAEDGSVTSTDGSAPDGGIPDGAAPTAEGGTGTAGDPNAADPDHPGLKGGVAAIGTVTPRGMFPAIAAATCASDEDTPNTPKAITLTNNAYSAAAGLNGTSDDDLFTWTAGKRDPTHVTLTYKAPASGAGDLDFVVRSVGNTPVASNYDTRSTESETTADTFIPDATGIYTLEINGDGQATACHPYQIDIDANWCSDALEDNDTREKATELDLAANARYKITANIFGEDDDFYRFVALRRDPILVRANYTVAMPTDRVNIDFVVRSADNNPVASDYDARTTASETLEDWVMPEAKGDIFHLSMYANGEVCAPYELIVDRNACTDVYEDNDKNEEAAAIEADTDVKANIMIGDDDVYDISKLGKGACTVTFTRATGSTQRLSLTAYDATGGRISGGDTSDGATATATVEFRADTAKYVRVAAHETNHCDNYTLRCTK